MATHASAEKAARQAVKHEIRNRFVRSSFRTEIKKLRTGITAAAGKKGGAEAQKKLMDQLSVVQRLLMKAASKNVIKRETASRQVARLSSAIHKATA